MAYLNEIQLIEAGKLLDRKRKEFSCPVARVDARGLEFYVLPKPLARDAKLRKHGVEVRYGIHGANWARIDPVTGDVRCGACHDGDDPTATPPPEANR